MGSTSLAGTGETASPARQGNMAGAHGDDAEARRGDGIRGDEDVGMEDLDTGREGFGDEGEGKEYPQPASHQDLWRALQSERDELKALRKKWGDQHWTVQAAKQRVAAADERWKNGKPAAQLSRVLQRAEQGVRKADERIEQTIAKIRALDEE